VNISCWPQKPLCVVYQAAQALSDADPFPLETRPPVSYGGTGSRDVSVTTSSLGLLLRILTLCPGGAMIRAALRATAPVMRRAQGGMMLQRAMMASQAQRVSRGHACVRSVLLPRPLPSAQVPLFPPCTPHHRGSHRRWK
jgi:hypothetical protein